MPDADWVINRGLARCWPLVGRWGDSWRKPGTTVLEWPRLRPFIPRLQNGAAPTPTRTTERQGLRPSATCERMQADIGDGLRAKIPTYRACKTTINRRYHMSAPPRLGPIAS